MCGIALVASGLRLHPAAAPPGPPPPEQLHGKGAHAQIGPKVEDLEHALRRRGPDNLATVSLTVRMAAALPCPALPQQAPSHPACKDVATAVAVLAVKLRWQYVLQVGDGSGDKASAEVEMQFLGSVLQLRGLNDVRQPLQDSAGNVLLFNGELYEGISLDSDDNDAEVLLRRLGYCCSCTCHIDPQMNLWREVQRERQGMESDASDSTADRRSDQPGRMTQQQASKSGAAESPSALALEQDRGAVASQCFVYDETKGQADQLGSRNCGSSNSTSSIVQLLSRLRGPWSLIYWQAASYQLWFGRDLMGRRSLLVHYPSAADQRFMLSSVAPTLHNSNATGDSPAEQSPLEVPGGSHQPLSSIPDYWEDLPCTIHSLSFLPQHSAAVQIKAGDRRTSGFLNAGARNVTADWTGRAECSADITPAELDPCSERSAHPPRYLTHLRGHAWQDPLLQRLILYARPSESQTAGSLDLPCNNGIVTHSQGIVDSASTSVMDTSAEMLLVALSEAVRLRDHIYLAKECCHLKLPSYFLAAWTAWFLQHWRISIFTNIEIMLSSLGAATRNKGLTAWHGGPLSVSDSIDLINVSFDLDLAPDRISAVEGLKELQQLSPMRRWHLVQVNSSLEELTSHQHHLRSLLCPASTYMHLGLVESLVGQLDPAPPLLRPHSLVSMIDYIQDLNIGTALWLASRGKGDLHPRSRSGAAAMTTSQEGQCEAVSATLLDNSCKREINMKAQEAYTSMARVLLVGAGADEQCAGYGRHRTRFRTAGWKGLEEELQADVQRLWRRNLGRDDRCIADNGKEARYPYLDENVMSLILDMPLHHIANLQLPLGVGDKLILRKVASKLGLHRAAALPKRAIQFGSRIARQSNLRDFGSNRAANAAGAGSVKFPAVPGASCHDELTYEGPDVLAAMRAKDGATGLEKLSSTCTSLAKPEHEFTKQALTCKS
eukprot:SM000360S13675  [mRNA]  locus=s360:1693:7369:- [translate_table: standard]